MRKKKFAHLKHFIRMRWCHFELAPATASQRQGGLRGRVEERFRKSYKCLMKSSLLLYATRIWLQIVWVWWFSLWMSEEGSMSWSTATDSQRKWKYVDLGFGDIICCDVPARSEEGRGQFVELPAWRRTSKKCVIRSDNKVSSIPSRQFLLCYSAK